ncbi:MAG: hypothetical protein IKZ41_04970 [Clostridia bacterium]|nr:hypothetical protein [Clostridia bacterium]
MCSIMSCYKSSVTPEEFRAGFERTKSRGPDESRIEEAGDGKGMTEDPPRADCAGPEKRKGGPA